MRASIKERVDRLKQIHCIISIFLFIGTVCFCSYTAQDLKLTNISLSHFGIYRRIGFVWNASLFIMGLMLFVEAYQSINKYLPHNILIYLFGFSIACLLLTATITMTHRVHFYTAYGYFISYTLGMFLFGYSVIKTDFRIGITSIIISLSSLVFPILAVMYLHTFAIPELTHTFFIFAWVLVTRFDGNYKNLLKQFGL